MKQLSLIEEELAEKRRLLFVYTQQKKALEVSIEHLERELKSSLEDARYALKMKQDSEKEISKYSEQIAALRMVLGPVSFDLLEEEEKDEERKNGDGFDEEENGEKHENEAISEENDMERHNLHEDTNEEQLTNSSDKERATQISSGYQKQLLELLRELIYSKSSQSSDSELASVRLRTLLQQINSMHNSIRKEYNLLVSKCHQINELDLSVGLLRLDGLIHELTMDHHLQSQVAIKTKSETKVLQVRDYK